MGEDLHPFVWIPSRAVAGEELLHAAKRDVRVVGHPAVAEEEPDQERRDPDQRGDPPASTGRAGVVPGPGVAHHGSSTKMNASNAAASNQSGNPTSRRRPDSTRIATHDTMPNASPFAIENVNGIAARHRKAGIASS